MRITQGTTIDDIAGRTILMKWPTRFGVKTMQLHVPNIRSENIWRIQCYAAVISAAIEERAGFTATIVE
jgi:hypothetical protein|nr:MAG TPA: hypothetical protein [Caudoviricetes sp.]